MFLYGFITQNPKYDIFQMLSIRRPFLLRRGPSLNHEILKSLCQYVEEWPIDSPRACVRRFRTFWYFYDWADNHDNR